MAPTSSRRPRTVQSSRPHRHPNQHLLPIDLSSTTAAAVAGADDVAAGAGTGAVAGAVVENTEVAAAAGGSEPNFSAHTAAEDPSTETPDSRSWAHLARRLSPEGTSLYYYSSRRFKFQISNFRFQIPHPPKTLKTPKSPPRQKKYTGGEKVTRVSLRSQIEHNKSWSFNKIFPRREDIQKRKWK